MGLLEKRGGQSEEDADTLLAHEVLDKIEDSAKKHVSPTRVVFASIAVLLMLAASLFVVAWVVPYDRVSVDVVYRQGGPGHVVLVELGNDGSRAIDDVDLSIRFIDSEGMEVGRQDFSRDSLPAHSSVSGDELELLIDGASVWENYTIEIILYYVSYDSERSERWTHDVGEWTMELFFDRSSFHFL
ncbi:MAG: hypothetical protein CMA85_01870 [Euryarchaeota archaeon]|nr:hypothetical protein [Euryarchaeota archaeon]